MSSFLELLDKRHKICEKQTEQRLSGKFGVERFIQGLGGHADTACSLDSENKGISMSLWGTLAVRYGTCLQEDSQKFPILLSPICLKDTPSSAQVIL